MNEKKENIKNGLNIELDGITVLNDKVLSEKEKTLASAVEETTIIPDIKLSNEAASPIPDVSVAPAVSMPEVPVIPTPAPMTSTPDINLANQFMPQNNINNNEKSFPAFDSTINSSIQSSFKSSVSIMKSFNSEDEIDQYRNKIVGMIDEFCALAKETVKAKNDSAARINGFISTLTGTNNSYQDNSNNGMNRYM